MPRAPGPPTEAGGPPDYGSPSRGPVPGSFYPLNIDRVLQLTVSLFRFRWRLFLGIALMILVPMSAVSGLLQAFTVEAIALSTQEMVLAVVRGDTSAASMLALIPWPALIASWLVSLLISLITYLALAATTHATAIAFGGGRPTVIQSLRQALSRFGALAVVYLVSFFVTLSVILVGGAVAGLLFLANVSNGSVQPGPFVFMALIVIVALIALVIFIAVRWSFAIAAVMIENAPGLNALRRSWGLAVGSSWRIFGYLLLFGLLGGLPAAVIGYVVTLFLGSGVAQTATGLIANPIEAFASTFVIGVIAALFSPFPTIALTLLYFDVRWRRGEPVPQPGTPIPPI
ncbi:MAG: glycerophosphoryl diester phosphodiesterase membrane domain-containing protein [Candidatus Limnocylindrales bacterium]